ncbi:MAG: hypothetical protein ACWGO1_15215, partial [Anaerolineales bacterium]
MRDAVISSSQTSSYPSVAAERAHRNWDPVLAALPHLWLGLGLLNGKVLTMLPEEMLAAISDILLVLLLAAGLIVALYAARNDHPLWTVSWSGYTLIALVAVPGRLIVLQGEDSYIYPMGFLMLAALAVLIGYFLRFRRQPLHALLMVLVFLLLGPLFFLDNVPYTVDLLFAVSLALMAAAIAVLVVLSRRWVLGAGVAFAASLLAGLALALVGGWQVA